MLYKRTTSTARTAQFAAGSKPDAEQAENATLSQTAGDPLPGREQLEIERLNHENSDLREELGQLRANWDKALAAAEARALESASRQHVADDGARLAALQGALDNARNAFDAAFGQQLMTTAAALAQAALARLVEQRDSETEWLVRTIERRLGDLRGDAVVELRLAPGIAPDLLARLRDQLPPGVVITNDPAIPEGTARIGLRLGRIEIDPAAGLGALLGAFEADQDVHGLTNGTEADG